MLKKKIIYSPLAPVYQHLAIEEFLLNELKADEMILFFWISEKAIVLGKNQNPWLECTPSKVLGHNCDLARRLSGGGTVFHDSGNLNVSFILNRDIYDKKVLIDTVIEGLQSIGIEANAGDRDIIELYGKKISGSAFALKKDRVIHHCTMLVNSDLDALNNLLEPEFDGTECKSIRSVPSPVCNINDYYPEVCYQDIIHSIANCFEEGCKIENISLNEPIESLIDQYESYEWTFVRTPKFNIAFTFAGQSYEAKIVKGKVKELLPSADAVSHFVNGPVEEIFSAVENLRIC